MNKQELLQLERTRIPTYDELLDFAWQIRKCLGTKEINLDYWNREANELFTPQLQPQKYS